MPDEYTTKEECKKHHADLLAVIKELKGSVNELNGRLYRDNGRKSIQTVLNAYRHLDDDGFARTVALVYAST